VLELGFDNEVVVNNDGSQFSVIFW